jgi:hypothetical protein
MTDVGFFASLARDTAAGAAAGAVAGPIGAGAGAVAAIISDVCDATGVTRWLFGAGAEATKQAVVSAVAQATGTADPEAQAAVLERDPEAALRLRASLASIAAAREAASDQARLDAFRSAVGDVQSARAQTAHLVDSKSVLAWGAPLVSLVTLLAYGAVTIACVILVSTRSLPEGATTILSLAMGSLTTLASAVVSFWVGSSAGSARKSETIERISAKAPP